MSQAVYVFDGDDRLTTTWRSRVDGELTEGEDHDRPKRRAELTTLRGPTVSDVQSTRN